MANTLTIRWNRDVDDLGKRLDRLARRTHRPRSYYVTSAVAANIDRWEREAELMEHAATITDAELAAELGWSEPTSDELAAALAMVK